MSSSRVSCLIQRLYAFDTMPLNSPRRKAIKETLYRLEEVYDSASRNILYAEVTKAAEIGEVE